jgi:hypothetical protein
MRLWLCLALVLPLAVVTGCSKKKKQAAPAEPAASQGSAAPHLPSTATVEQRRAAALKAGNLPRMALGQLTPEEVAPMMPTLATATPLGEPSAQGGGRQVRQSMCLGTADLAEAGTEVQKAMTERGFTTSKPQARGAAGHERTVLSGLKDDYRLSANIVASSKAECSERAEVLFTFHKVVHPKAGEAGGPGGAMAPSAPGGSMAPGGRRMPPGRGAAPIAPATR